MSTQKIDLIRQALSAAESSIKLARQLLGELEKEGPTGRPKAKELPGTIGVFDGQNMITESGEGYPVPENYASKSILVVGDTLKLVGQGKDKRFKQIEHVKRHKTAGILAKKDGKWAVVTSEGSYRVIPAAVSYFEGNVGDEALVQLPASNLQTTWAAVEKITKKGEVKETKTEGKEEPEVKKDVKEEKEKEVSPKEEKIKIEPRAKPEKKEKEKAPVKEVSKEKVKPEATVEEAKKKPSSEAKPAAKTEEMTEDELR